MPRWLLAIFQHDRGLTEESAAGVNASFHHLPQGNGYSNGYASYYSSTYAAKKPTEAMQPEREPTQPNDETPSSYTLPAAEAADSISTAPQLQSTQLSVANGTVDATVPVMEKSQPPASPPFRVRYVRRHHGMQCCSSTRALHPNRYPGLLP